MTRTDREQQDLPGGKRLLRRGESGPFLWLAGFSTDYSQSLSRRVGRQWDCNSFILRSCHRFSLSYSQLTHF